MQIVQLHAAYIRQIVSMHMMFLPGTAEAVGEEYMTNFYIRLFHQNHHTVLGAFDKKKLIGFVVGTQAVKELLSLTHPPVSFKTSKKILLSVFTGKVSIITLIERVLFEHTVRSQVEDGHGYIFVLVVSGKYQRQGIGKKLVSTIEKILPSPLWVDTSQTNTNAQKFYSHIGFTQIVRMYNSVLFRKEN